MTFRKTGKVSWQGRSVTCVEESANAFLLENPKFLAWWRLLETDWPLFQTVNQIAFDHVTDGVCVDDRPVLHIVWEATLNEYQLNLTIPDRSRLLRTIAVLIKEIARWVGPLRLRSGDAEWSCLSDIALGTWSSMVEHIDVGHQPTPTSADTETWAQGMWQRVSKDHPVLREAWHDGRKEKIVMEAGSLGPGGGTLRYHVSCAQCLDQAGQSR